MEAIWYQLTQCMHGRIQCMAIWPRVCYLFKDFYWATSLEKTRLRVRFHQKDSPIIIVMTTMNISQAAQWCLKEWLCCWAQRMSNMKERISPVMCAKQAVSHSLWSCGCLRPSLLSLTVPRDIQLRKQMSKAQIQIIRLLHKAGMHFVNKHCIK